MPQVPPQPLEPQLFPLQLGVQVGLVVVHRCVAVWQVWLLLGQAQVPPQPSAMPHLA